MSDFSYQTVKQDWGVDELVIRLQHLRVQSMEIRQRLDQSPSYRTPTILLYDYSPRALATAR